MWYANGKIDQRCRCVMVPMNRNSRQGRDIGSYESYELQFPKFTDNYGTVSLNIHLKSVPFLSHWDKVEKK